MFKKRIIYNQIHKNKYGDIIISSISGNIDFDDHNIDINNETVVIKSLKEVKDNRFKLVYKFEEENVYIYGNDRAIDMCPSIINNKAKYCIIIPYIIIANKDYILFNKYYKNSWIKHPSGYMAKGENIYGSCVRNLENETGIVSDNIKLIKNIGKSNSKIFAYDEKCDIDINYFYVEIKLDMDKFVNLMRFKSIEVEKTYLIPIYEFDRYILGYPGDHNLYYQR